MAGEVATTAARPTTIAIAADTTRRPRTTAGEAATTTAQTMDGVAAASAPVRRRAATTLVTVPTRRQPTLAAMDGVADGTPRACRNRGAAMATGVGDLLGTPTTGATTPSTLRLVSRTGATTTTTTAGAVMGITIDRAVIATRHPLADVIARAPATTTPPATGKATTTGAPPACRVRGSRYPATTPGLRGPQAAAAGVAPAATEAGAARRPAGAAALTAGTSLPAEAVRLEGAPGSATPRHKAVRARLPGSRGPGTPVRPPEEVEEVAVVVRRGVTRLLPRARRPWEVGDWFCVIGVLLIPFGTTDA